MKNQTTSTQLFDQLAGSWKGEGRGQFPGVTSFKYRETLTFTRRDEKTLAYEQRTQKLYDGQAEYLESHWENGFIGILEYNVLELINAQMGRSEVLTGTVEAIDTVIRIRFVSKTIMNDPRMISSARTFELQDDVLRYEVEMHTTKVNELSPHLKIVLERIKQE